MSRRSLTLMVATSAAAVLALSACGSNTPSVSGSTNNSASSSTPTSSSQSSTAATVSSSSATSAISAAGAGTIAGCTPTDLKTKVSGKMTAATDDPAYDPWFSNDDPSNGKGYESAVAYAVAAKLGYSKSQVTWTRAKFDAVISPAPKAFDFDINEFSISDTRKQAVDFSSGYYDVHQAIVTTKSSPFAKATTLAALKGAKLGAQIGTTSLDAVNNQIMPTTKAAVFQTNDAAVQALQNHQIDAIVVDLPTAVYMAGNQVKDGVVIGSIPAPTSGPEQFGLLLEKGSSLTSCVTKAVDALRTDGTLAKLQTQWLSSLATTELK